VARRIEDLVQDLAEPDLADHGGRAGQKGVDAGGLLDQLGIVDAELPGQLGCLLLRYLPQVDEPLLDLLDRRVVEVEHGGTDPQRPPHGVRPGWRCSRRPRRRGSRPARRR
jgi:hypothetical protein